MTTTKRYAPETRERAVRLVLETAGDHTTQWTAISSIAAKIGCTKETLRSWVRQAETDAGTRSGARSEERERIRLLEREVRELKRANEILRKASAYFAALATLEWVWWFNNHRLLGPIGFVPPAEFEAAYYLRLQTPEELEIHKSISLR